ncbi:hypothetical protein VUR80DRAFT_5602 [Thermomyces stellatus]
MSGHDKVSITPLSIWDQSTSRFHIRLVLCFGVENDQREQVTAHLRTTLDRLARLRPEFAGRLLLGERRGWVYLRESPEHSIPFDTCNIEGEFGYTYEELKAQSFPAKAFVHPRFGYRGGIADACCRVPVAVVRAFFIDGGMLLATFLHHTFGDGECMLEFLRAFAAQSRGVHIKGRGTRSLEFTRSKVAAEKRPSFEQLLARCPEFVRTEPHLGPNQPIARPGGRPMDSYVRDGKIFVFTNATIRHLKEVVSEHAPSARPPSSYVVLASLIWAHAASARLQTETHEPTWGDAGEAVMTNPVNWRYRAFTDRNGEYYGNAATLAQTRVGTEELRRACGDEAEWARLARRLEARIRAVDDAYVRARVEMFESAPDPRELGLVMDPRVPQDLAFNTWREFGADTVWDLGVSAQRQQNGSSDGANGEDGAVGGVRPDKLRRSQDEWNVGGTLILPAREGSDVYEVLLTIPRPAMDLLRADGGFMKWVDGVLD